MRNRIVISLMAVLALCGCQTKELDEVITESKVFTATIEDNFTESTKTSLDEKGNVLWKKGDQVSIFNGSTINQKYQVSDSSDGKTAADLNPVSSSGFSAGSEIDNNVAFYPYHSTAAISKDEGTYVISDITLPSTQNYAVGCFGNGAFPMVAVTSSTSDLSLKFKNVLGCLKLQLKGTARITSIQITGNNDEILCGEVSVTAATGTVPSINLTDESAKTVTLDCGSGVQLNNATSTSFVIALPPMTMTSGFTVIVTDTEGKQMEIKTTKSQTIVRSRLLKMPVVNYEGADPSLNKPFTITSVGSTSVAIIKEGTPYKITLEYRKGEGVWNAYSIGTSVDLTNGETLQFRAGEGGNIVFSEDYINHYNVVATGIGTINVSGNIISLLDKNLEKKALPLYAFMDLFKGCTKLIDASNLKLPASSLAVSCYDSMFFGCTSLTAAPALPATNLAKFCYHCMFSGCTNLASAPALPATTLAENCYNIMFYGCTSLTAAPELPATTLAKKCYENMFYGCTSLTTAPKLPATTLAVCCYFDMFSGCTSLTTAPKLPSTSLKDCCYYEMFLGCTSLTQAPELPATTLAESCYERMFLGCTSLTRAPELPATTLVSNCYSGMFSDCSSLNHVKALFTTTPSSSYTYDWLFGVSSTGTFVKSKDATWNVRGANGIPSSWTVQTE